MVSLVAATAFSSSNESSVFIRSRTACSQVRSGPWFRAKTKTKGKRLQNRAHTCETAWTWEGKSNGTRTWGGKSNGTRTDRNGVGEATELGRGGDQQRNVRQRVVFRVGIRVFDRVGRPGVGGVAHHGVCLSHLALGVRREERRGREGMGGERLGGAMAP